MGAEDFSYFLLERPGCFFNVGSRNEERGFAAEEKRREGRDEVKSERPNFRRQYN